MTRRRSKRARPRWSGCEPAHPAAVDLLPGAAAVAADRRQSHPARRGPVAAQQAAEQPSAPDRAGPPSAARSWSTARRSPSRCRARTSTSTSASTPAAACTPPSPATSRSSPRRRSSGAENGVLSGTDSRLFVRRLSDYFTGRQPKGGAVVLTLDAATQQAAAPPWPAARAPSSPSTRRPAPSSPSSPRRPSTPTCSRSTTAPR